MNKIKRWVNMKNKLPLFIAFFYTLLALIKPLQADDAIWNKTNGGAWNQNSNWTAPFPDAAGEIAAFAFQPTISPTITSTKNITIGRLNFFNANATLDFTANNRSLIFDNHDHKSQLFLDGVLTIKNRVLLKNDLNIISANGDFLQISGSISGKGGITFSGITNMGALQLFPNISNSYKGTTTILSGSLQIAAADNVVVIPTDLFLKEAALRINSGNNLLKHSIDVDGFFSTITFGNLASVSQTVNSLTLRGGRVSEVNSSQLTIQDFIAIGDNAFVRMSQIKMRANTHITNKHIGSGRGVFSGPSVATIIDLSGSSFNHPVFLDVSSGNFLDYDLNFDTVNFLNGFLIKTGGGIIAFTGTCTLPDSFRVEGGTVTMGLTFGEIITSTGSVNLKKSLLNGFGTLSGNLVNASGVVNPGNPRTIALLTLENYRQKSRGSLLIKVNSAALSGYDQLTVTGNAILDGTLVIDALPGATLNAGDTLLIIAGSHTGKFKNIVANIPEGLEARVLYNPADVTVELVAIVCPACPPCPSPSSDCPSTSRNSSALKLINRR